MRVKLQGGQVYIVVLTTETTNYGHQDIFFISKGFMVGKNYDEDLVYRGDDSYDIIEVYHLIDGIFLLDIKQRGELLGTDNHKGNDTCRNRENARAINKDNRRSSHGRSLHLILKTLCVYSMCIILNLNGRCSKSRHNHKAEIYYLACSVIAVAMFVSFKLLGKVEGGKMNVIR